jgi:mannosyltransferase
VGVKVEDVKIQSGVRPESQRASAVASDRIGQVAVVGTAVAATLGLLPWLGNSMFADEGATLYSAHLSWSNLWAQSLHVDLVLLPYYVLVHFWVMLSESIAWVRALSLFAFFGTIVAAGGLGLRLAGRWCGIIAAVLTASSTLLILKALNARPYELSALLVALSAVSLFKWLDDARARWLWAFSFLAILATTTQLFALLAPASMLLCVLGARPRLLAQRLRALLAPIVLLAVVSGTWITASTGELGQVNWIAQGSAGGLLLAELRGPVLGQAYDLVIFVIVVLVLAKLAIIWDRGVRHAVAQQIGRDRDIFALTIGWAILPTLALSIASLAHPVYANRYVAASAPGAALLVAFVCVRVFPATLDPARVWMRYQAESLAVGYWRSLAS